jgi:hypothetical protein
MAMLAEAASTVRVVAMVRAVLTVWVFEELFTMLPARLSTVVALKPAEPEFAASV